jgi:DNA modification methylase
MKLGIAQVIRADSRNLPLADNTVDLVVTSPPYFALRSYQDGGEHYAGQIGDEPTPAEFVASLLEVTRECVRVLKPTGSLWVNLGDKYSQRTQQRRSSHQPGMFEGKFPEFADTWAERAKAGATRMPHQNIIDTETGNYVREKSLIGIPWRYALRCIDDLGLILRAEVIWSKPNGLPESVTDRVRRSHEQWFHFTLEPRYFSAVDEIREEHAPAGLARRAYAFNVNDAQRAGNNPVLNGAGERPANPLGKLPGSVWTVATEPLRVPDHLGIDHFAAFPTEWPRRIIQGWSPAGVCTQCGEGRRPVSDVTRIVTRDRTNESTYDSSPLGTMNGYRGDVFRTITGESCACPEPTAPTRPPDVLDPIGGTGTTALVAKALGRHGITVDMSADYCRLAEWRTNDRNQLAKVLGIEKTEEPDVNQLDLFGGEVA